MIKNLTERIQTGYAIFRAKQVVRKAQEAGRQSVYHFHVMKTAGTSVNQAFMSLYGKPEDMLPAVYKAPLHTFRADQGVISSGKYLIEKGIFTYGFTHFPFYEIKPPETAFTFTCLRLPFERVFSRYRELKTASSHPLFRKRYPQKMAWVSRDFAHFVRTADRREIVHSLVLFSEKMEPNEAFDRICGLDYYFFTEKFDEGLQTLAGLTARPLEILKVNQSPKAAEVSELLREEIEEKYLKDEIRLYELLLKNYER